MWAWYAAMGEQERLFASRLWENMKRHGCIDGYPGAGKTGEELDENDGIWICDCLAVNDSLYKECIECGQPKPKKIETDLLEPVAQEKEAAETTIAAEGNVTSDMADEKFKPVEKQEGDKDMGRAICF